MYLVCATRMVAARQVPHSQVMVLCILHVSFMISGVRLMSEAPLCLQGGGRVS
jgi:hypothetical protein